MSSFCALVSKVVVSKDPAVRRGARALATCLVAVALVTPTKHDQLSAQTSQAQLRYQTPALAFDQEIDARSHQTVYSAQVGGLRVRLAPGAAELTLRASGNLPASPMGLEAVGGHLASPRPENSLSASSSYFETRDTRNWQVNAPLYGQIRYSAIYPGIDLTFYGHRNHLEYDFSVAPGANPNRIKLRLRGVQQAEVDAAGNLVLHVNGQTLSFRKPLTYQNDPSHSIASSYTLSAPNDRDVEIGFAVGAYDRSRPLVIDPVMEYARYVGTGLDRVNGVATDTNGAAYVLSGSGVGTLAVRQFDANGDLQRIATIALPDAAVRLQGSAIAVSATGAVYVAGSAAPGLPTTENAAQITSKDGVKAFLAVLQPKNGALQLSYLSYLGGDAASLASGLALGSDGAAYIAGMTTGPDFPASANALQKSVLNNAASTGFVIKVDPRQSGSDSIVYATLLGSGAHIQGIAASAAGEVYLLHDSDTAIGLTPGALDYGSSSYSHSMQLTKLDAFGTHVLYSANLGQGTGSALAVDASGAAYVAGQASTGTIAATPNAYRSDAHGGFVLKVSPTGASLGFMTYLGGSGAVIPQSIALAGGCVSNCTVYVAGSTAAADFPSIRSIQTVAGALPAAFVVKLSSDGSSSQYSTLLGGLASSVLPASVGLDGSTDVAGPMLAVDSDGNAHVAGNLAAVSAPDFPVTKADSVSGAFLASIENADLPQLVAVPSSVSFGQGTVGGAPVTGKLSLRNMGSAPLALGALQLSPSNEFEATNDCGSQLSGGAGCTVSLSFYPAASGARTGNLQIQSAKGASLLGVSLAGTGQAALSASATKMLTVRAMTSSASTAPVTLNPASLAFGNQVVGTAATTLTSTLTNTGSASLTISSVSISGTNASQFAFVSPIPKGACLGNNILAVGASCTINVKYTPILGSASAAVTIVDSAGTQTLPLTGTGVASPIPFVGVVTPRLITPGTAGATLSIRGANFVSGASVRWNNTALTTTVNSSSQATATVPSTLLAASSTGVLTVVNPKPTGVVSNQVQMPVGVFTPTVAFNPSLFPALSVNQPTALLPVDLNSDYKPDLVVVDGLDGQVQVFINAGSGRMSLKSTVSVGASPVAVAAGDFNEDGKLDLAVLNASGTVSILSGDGSGNFTKAATFSAGSSGQSIVAGDFNSDGHLDLAVLNAASSVVALFQGSGANAFTSVSTAGVGTSPYAMLAADFNGDGLLDLAVGNADGSVSILLGSASGSFTVSSISTGQAAASMAVADLNEDGFADLAVAGTSGTVSILTGTGTGTFAPGTAIVAGAQITSIAAADFNDDGHLDLVVAGPAQSQAFIFYGSGAATFSAGPVLPTVSAPSTLVAVDFDNSGYSDLAVASSSKNAVQVQIQEPLASVTPSSIVFGQQLINVASQTRAINVANNGSYPLVISSISINPATNTGATDFAQSNTCGTLPASVAPGTSCTINVTFTPSKAAVESAVLGVFDNSGGSNANQTVSVSGTGVSSSSTQSALSASAITYGSAAQIVATVTGSAATPAGNVTLTVGSNAPITQALVNGTTTFTVSGLSAGSYPLSLSFPAQNNFTASSASATLVVNKGMPVLQWSNPASIVAGTALSATQLNATASVPGTFAYSPAAGTVLSAGANQTLSAVFTPTDAVDYISGGVVSALINVVSPVPYLSAVSPAAISPAAAASGFTLKLTGANVSANSTVRWNGTALTTSLSGTDQLSAQVPSGLVSGAQTGVVTVVNPAPSGVLSNSLCVAVTSAQNQLNLTGAPVAPLSVNQPAALTVADFNADGNQDLAVLDAADGTVQIFLGSANGTFTLQASSPVGTNPAALTTGDFNQDGKTDIALVTSAGQVTILTGDGTGNFTSTASFSAGSSAQAIATADLNTDGQLDLLVVNSAGNTVTELIGSGAGTFSQLAQFSTGAAPYAVVVADFNQDGLPDFAVGNADGSVSVYLNSGAGIFTLSGTVSTGSQATAIVVGDFNEDGLPDLLVANSNGNVTLLVGNGTGSFSPAVSATVAAGVTGIRIADLNGDGHLDAIVVNQAANTLQILYGTGAGSFSANPAQTLSGAPGALRIADFNNDGRADIAVSIPASNSVLLLVQAPNASLSTNSLNLGTSSPGAATSPQSFSITNNGPLPLTISSISITPGANTGANDFAQTNSCGTLPAALAPGATCAVTVTFVPSNGGAESAVLTITDNANGVSGTTQTVSLAGAGSQHATTVSLSAPDITYGQTAQVVVTVSNSGGSSIPGGTITLSAANLNPVTQSLVNGTTTFNLAGLSAGNYALTATYSPKGPFASGSAGGTLVVAQAVPVLQWAQPLPIATAVALSWTQLDATSSVPGTFAYQPGPGSILGVGKNQTLTATFTPSDPVDYAGGTVSTTITVTANPVPYLNPVLASAVTPATAAAGFNLNLNGTGFGPATAVKLNGTALTTTVTGGTQLSAVVPAALITGAGVAQIKVYNPESSKGGLSNTVYLPVTTAFNNLTFASAGSGSMALNQPAALAVGDFDGDGNPDVAVLDAQDGLVQIYLGAATGVLTPYITQNVGPNPVSIAVGDFNEDGRVDLAVANANGNVSILMGNGKGYFSLLSSFTAGTSAQAIAVADLNLDGHLDVAVINPATNAVSVWFGAGNGSLALGSTLSTGPAPYGIAISDYNRDGYPDLAIGNGDGSISVYLGTYSGAFTQTGNATTGSAASSLVTGDFNEDGIPDLAVANTNGKVTILTGTGSGAFAVASTATIPSGPQTINIGDFNGDGHIDLAVSSQNANNVTVLQGAGNATFTTQPAISLGAAPNSFAVVDLNSDGRQDFVAIMSAANTVSSLFQVPTASVTPASLNFGTPLEGRTTAAQNVTLSNNGSATLTVSALTIVPGNNAGASDFTQTNTCGSQPISLAPGTSCTMSVALSASTPSAENATLAITDNSGLVTGSVQSVALADNGATFYLTQLALTPGPSVAYGSPTSATVTVTSPDGTPTGRVTLVIDSFPAASMPLSNGTAVFSLTSLTAGVHQLTATFPNQGSYGTSSATGSITVTKITPSVSWAAPAAISVGTPLSAIQLNAAASVAGSYTYSPAAGTVLGVGNGQPLSVTFTPVDTKDYNSATTSTSINVVALATPVSVTPAALNFNNQLENVYSATQTVTVNNTGSSAITFKGVALGASGSTQTYLFFSISTGTGTCIKGATLAAGASCTVPLRFKPTALGAAAGYLNIGYTIGTSTTQIVQSVALSGNGIANPIPVVYPIVPSAVLPSTAMSGFNLFVPGASFNSSSVVSMNGKALTTQLVTNNGVTGLQALVPSGLITAESSGVVTVSNAKPTGLPSNFGTVAFTNPLNTSNFSLGPFAPNSVNKPSMVYLVDLTGDRYPDLVVLDTLDNQVLAYVNATSGRVTLTSTTNIAGNITAAVAGDFNEDGKIDFAVATSNGQITVLLGSGSGTFTAMTPFSAGSSAQGIAAADLNLDGHLDLVVTNPTANSATVLAGQGNGTFTTAATVPAGPSPFGAAIADFNLDGIPDLAIGNADGSVSILVANSSGSYVPASTPPTGAAAVAIAMGDFNEDGIPDLAVLNTDNAVSILTGTGTGVFNLTSTVATGNTPQSLVLGDLNGDGHLDLAVANTGDNTVSILYGTGASSFSSPVILNVASTPLAVAAADMNNDGRVDLAVTSGGANSFSILMQNPLTSVSATSLSFGQLQYGQTSPTQTFTISNTGSGPLFVSSLQVHPGYNSIDFNMTTNCGTAPLTINPQTSCWVTISYTPSRIGFEAATFQVVDNSNNVGNSAHYVYLTGTGLPDPTTTSLTVPSTVVYGSSVPVNVTVSAPESVPTGAVNLSVGSFAPLTQKLSASGTASFQVTGIPAGTYNVVANYPAQLQYGTSAFVGSIVVQPATPTISWPSPAAITQGSPLTATQLNAAASVAGTFSYNPPLATILNAGTQTLSVTFTPTDTANYTSASATTTIQVVAPSSALFLTQPALTYSATATGTNSAAQTSYLVNSGSASVSFGALSITGTNSSSFQFVTPAPATSCLNAGGTLAPGARCSLDIYFNPQAAGTLSAGLSISNSSGTLTLALSGSGTLNPSPYLQQLAPAAINVATAPQGYTFKVIGTGFVSGSTVTLNGRAVPTTFINSGTLQAQIASGTFAAPTTLGVKVINPGKGSATSSNMLSLPVSTPTATSTLGVGPFTPAAVNTPQASAIADFNNDGFPDVAVTDTQDGQVLIYLGSSTGALTLRATLAVGVAPASLATGDFNEDGQPDLVVLSSAGTYTVWSGDGTGNFAAGSSVAATSTGTAIYAADFNADGHLDLAIVNSASQTIAIMTGTGNSAFNSSSTVYTGVGPYGIAIADFNKDGILDLAVGDSDGTVGIFLGNGDATFTQATSFDTGDPAGAITTADFNEDGIPDLAIAEDAVTGVGTNGAVTIWTGTGNGLFTQQGTAIAAGNTPDAIAVGDFNGDGHMDIAVASLYSNYVQLLMGSGAGSFVNTPAQAAGSRPIALGVADFNNDGRLDLLSVDSGSNSMEVLFQVPQAALSSTSLVFPTQALGTASSPMSVTISNSGSATAPLVITNIAVSPAFNTAAGDFAQSNFCGTLPASLAPGASCTINVTFSPTAVAAESANLIITDNAGGVAGSTQQVNVSGTVPLPSNILATTQVNLTPSLAIPTNFLGLSFDWQTAENWIGNSSAGWDSTFQQLLNNLTAYNAGPLSIRVAGDSIDTGTINSTTVQPFAQLAQSTNVHYILGLNLDLQTPSLTQSQAQAYAAGVPNSSIDAFEIGNEPDNYVSNGARGSNYGVQPYLTEWASYQQAVVSAVPTLTRFADAALAGSLWMPGMEAGMQAGQLPVNIVTQHSYITCNNKTNPAPLNLLLQPFVATSAPNLYGPFASVAHAQGSKFRIGEMNSICNGGQTGLSNNFTAALWGVDTMFDFVNAGVDGVNWHTSQGSSYNAFNINITTKSGKNTYTLNQVNPLYYGLLMFAQATANNAQMLPVTTLTNANLSTWATLDASGVVHLVLINKDQTATGTLQFSVPGYSNATALPLTAPSYTSTNGVQYAGQTFDGSTNGQLQGTQVTQSLTPAGGVFSINVPPVSAVLINLTH